MVGYHFTSGEGPRSYTVTTRNEGGAPLIEQFDMLGRKTRSQTSQLGQMVTTTIGYDAFDRPVQESNPTQGTPTAFTSYQYDLLDRVVEVTTPDGATTQKIHGGLTTTVINPLKQRKVEVKGIRGETLQIIDGDDQTLSYTYDAAGNLVSTTDPQNNTISLEYDAINRNIAMDDPDMGSWQYGFNGYGDLVSQTDGNGQSITMEYDQLGRITSQTTSDGTATWEWDSASTGIGQLAVARGSEYEYVREQSYDELGRPSATRVSVEGSTGFTTNWSYDNYSRLEQVVHPDNIIEAYSYSGDGTLAAKNISQGNTQLSEWQVEAMDGWGHATREEINGRLILTNSYDPARGRIDRISATADGHQVQDLSFAWDRIGNLNRRINTVQDQEELFEYDRLNRLVAATVNNVTTRVDYDAIGNILWKSDVGTYSYGQNGAGPHALTHVDTSTAEQPVPFSTNNPAGTYTYDDNGNLLSGGERTVEWNGLNMPRRITGPNQVDSYFLYGPEGQRIAKDTSDGNLTVYLSEVHELLLDANDQATSRLTLPLGSARAEILVGSQGVANRYLLLDHLGSTEVILDQDLVILEQLSFDPWGKRRQFDWSPAAQSIESSTPTGFTGHEMDDETGLVNMNARLYDPLLGRFLSADTMIPQPKNLQSFNRYSYVVNNPLRYVDLTGHEPHDVDISDPSERGDEDDDYEGEGEVHLDEITVTASRPDPAPNDPDAMEEGSNGDVTSTGEAGTTSTDADTEVENTEEPVSALDSFKRNTYAFYGFTLDALYNGLISPACTVLETPDYLLDGMFEKWGFDGLDTPEERYAASHSTPFPGDDLVGGVLLGINRTSKAVRRGLLPDDAWNKNAPHFVTPGTKNTIHEKYNTKTKQLEISKVEYDQYGRQEKRTDYSDHGYGDTSKPKEYHSNPHVHTYEYGPGYDGKGKETRSNQ